MSKVTPMSDCAILKEMTDPQTLVAQVQVKGHSNVSVSPTIIQRSHPHRQKDHGMHLYVFTRDQFCAEGETLSSPLLLHRDHH